jgi:hypothetical protein
MPGPPRPSRAEVAEWLMRRTADPFPGGSIPSLGFEQGTEPFDQFPFAFGARSRSQRSGETRLIPLPKSLGPEVWTLLRTSSDRDPE